MTTSDTNTVSQTGQRLLSLQENEQAHFADILRVIVEHPLWFVPARDGQPLLQNHEDAYFLHIYTSEEQLNEHNAEEIGSIEFTSLWLFDNLPPVRALIVDGHTAHALQIPAEYFDNLHKLNQAVQLEELLVSPSKEDNFLIRLKDYSHYLLPLIQDADGQNHIALAPDHQQRSLVAVFTAEDAAHLFIEAAKDKLGNLVLDWVDGEKLFHHLDLLPIDGLVFNCYGPTNPIAINKDTIRKLASINRP